MRNRTIPPLIRLTQPVVGSELKSHEIQVALLEATRQLSLEKLAPGSKVAVLVGSRGISNLRLLVSTLVDILRDANLRPSVVAAMGSHGGGTNAGQLNVLKRLGITPDTVGCPVLVDVETFRLPQSDVPASLIFSRSLAGFDCILPVNRVKQHTSFAGKIESGLSKMLLIGAGGPAGAAYHHRECIRTSWDVYIHTMTARILKTMPVVGGVAIVENSGGKTHKIYPIRREWWIEDEEEVLELSRRFVVKLPFEQIDLLIVDEIGKNISGAGMDTYVIGKDDRNANVKIEHIYVRSLTKETGGNGTGVGLATMCHQRVLDQLDPEETRRNCEHTAFPESGRPPKHIFSNDLKAIYFAFTGIAEEIPRVVWIKNTLELQQVRVSHGCDLSRLVTSSLLGGLEPWHLDDNNNFAMPWEYDA